MSRDLLNDLPDWALGLLFVAGTVLVVVAGLAAVCRLLPAWRDERSSQTVGGVAAMVMTMFALVLAFVIVNLYSSYESAVNSVSTEATSLSELVRDADQLPPRVRHSIAGIVARYVVEVRGHEFRALRVGRDDAHAQQLLTSLSGALGSYSPVTTAQQAFYNSAAEQLHTTITARENRLDAAQTSIPGPLLALMLLLAVLTLALSLLIQTHRRSVDTLIVAFIAIVVSAGLLTAVILQYPFSGSIAVTSDPFNSGALTQFALLHR